MTFCDGYARVPGSVPRLDARPVGREKSFARAHKGSRVKQRNPAQDVLRVQSIIVNVDFPKAQEGREREDGSRVQRCTSELIHINTLENMHTYFQSQACPLTLIEVWEVGLTPLVLGPVACWQWLHWQTFPLSLDSHLPN